MAIVKIELEAVRTDRYQIDFDQTIINDEWLTDYSKTFSKVYTPQELATHLAFQVLRKGTDNFYEGFGYIKMLRKDGTPKTQFKGNLEPIKEEEYAPGITLTLLCLDDEHDFNTINIKAVNV